MKTSKKRSQRFLGLLSRLSISLCNNSRNDQDCDDGDDHHDEYEETDGGVPRTV